MRLLAGRATEEKPMRESSKTDQAKARASFMKIDKKRKRERERERERERGTRHRKRLIAHVLFPFLEGARKTATGNIMKRVEMKTRRGLDRSRREPSPPINVDVDAFLSPAGDLAEN